MARHKLRIDGPAGKLETVIDDPGAERRGLALIAHPHPLYGGSLSNKVVTTLAKILYGKGYVAVRPNFRGVGASEGAYDEGRGEVADMRAVLDFVRERYPDMELVLAGFSFGAVVQSQLSMNIQPQHLLLVSPALNLFPMGAAPANTLVIHGERDELVPLEQVRAWTTQHSLRLAVVRGADHFFNKKLAALKQQVIEQCRC